MNPMYLVIIAGISAGAYQIFRKVVSVQLNSYWAATIFSGVAVVVGAVLIIVNKQSLFIKSNANAKSLGLALLGGLLVFPIDYFIIKAYNQGLPISIGTIVLTGLSAATAVIFGLLIGESLNIPKVLGMLFVLAGIIILKYQL